MRRNLFVLFLLAFVGLGGFLFYFSRGQSSPPLETTKDTPSQTSTPSALPLEVSATNVVLGVQNNSGETGVVSLVEKDGKVMVAINLMGIPLDTKQPVSVYSGTCLAPVKSLYPVTSVLNGWGEATLDVKMDELKKLMPLSIRVYKSETEKEDLVACGDVVFP